MESGVAIASVRDRLAVSRCDASDRVRGKTQVVHRRAAQVYMCSGEEWDGMNEEGVDVRGMKGEEE